MRSPELYDRLKSFRFEEPGAALTFAGRLARENQWSLVFAQRVVAEYLRFVYLATISDVPVTPSIAVDQAWHLHLVYTRSYWEDLCRAVLPRPLHHGPTRGGRAEADKFAEWYERTLALYHEEFGAPPPADIWPPGVDRFAPEAQPLTVTRRDFWVIERRLVRRIAVAIGATAAAVPLWIGAKNADAVGLTVIAVIFVGVVMLSLASSKRSRQRRNRKREDGSGCAASGCGTDSGCGGSGCGSSGCGGGGGCGGGD